jgi:hypothetical protein
MGIFAKGYGVSGASSAGGASAGTFNLKTGVAASIQALMCLGPDGLAYPAQTIDYAAKPNIGDACITTATVVAGTPAYYGRVSAVAQGDNGDTFVGTANAAGGFGFTVYRYAATGALVNSLNVGVFGALCYDPHLVKLVNGNIAASWSNGVDLYYCVLSPTLAVVQGATLVTGINANQQHDMIALSGGGFMLAYTDKITTTLTRAVVYSNTGAVVTAITTIFTWTGGAGGSGAYVRLAELSNGNVVAALQGSYTGGTYLGLMVGVLTPLAAVAVAFTSVDAGLQTVPPEVNAFGGFFCIARYDAGSLTLKTRVLNNALVQQGATYSPTVSANLGSTNTHRIINDGTNFWQVWCPSAGSVPFSLVKITTAGATTAYGIGLNGASTQYVDMFYERGRIVFTNMSSGGSMKFSVFNTSTLTQEVLNQSMTVTDGQYHQTIYGGDFSLICVGGGNTASSTMLAVQKYANTAVMGVSTAAAAAGAMVPIASLSGAYGINLLKGATSKSFDHTTGANIAGNKGTLLTYGAILKGF